MAVGERRSGAKKWLDRAGLVGIVALLLALGAARWWFSPESRSRNALPEFKPPPPVKPFDVAEYVGNAACRECHPGQTALHARSGHARTLRAAWRSPVATRLAGRSVTDPEDPDITWKFELGRQSLEVDRIEQGKVERLPIDYAFGSGNHGVTFVTVKRAGAGSSTPAVVLEHRLSYYAKPDKLDITVGQKRGDRPASGSQPGREGRWLDEKYGLLCFGCHTTMTSNRGNSWLDPATFVANVGCERCHGPGRDHIAAARRGDDDLWMPNGTSETAPNAQLRMCGECHRHALDEIGKPMDPNDPAILRFQPIGLMKSRCYQSGFSGLRCTTCHDPHAKTSNDTVAYENQCRSCHQAAPQLLCSISPAPSEGCVGCHMPKRPVPEGFLFTDHWIGKPSMRPAPRAPNAEQPAKTGGRG